MCHRFLQCVAVAFSPLQVEEVTRILSPFDVEAQPIASRRSDSRPKKPEDTRAIQAFQPGSLLPVVGVERFILSVSRCRTASFEPKESLYFFEFCGATTFHRAVTLPCLSVETRSLCPSKRVIDILSHAICAFQHMRHRGPYTICEQLTMHTSSREANRLTQSISPCFRLSPGVSCTPGNFM